MIKSRWSVKSAKVNSCVVFGSHLSESINVKADFGRKPGDIYNEVILSFLTFIQ